MTQAISRSARDVEALGANCPDPKEVKAVLEELGLHLEFEMEAIVMAKDLHIAPLPAQFHFSGPRGVEVIYLAGKDVSGEQFHPLPPHASRWWAFPGANPLLCAQITKALSARWRLHWRTSAPDTPSRALSHSA